MSVLRAESSSLYQSPVLGKNVRLSVVCGKSDENKVAFNSFGLWKKVTSNSCCLYEKVTSKASGL